jgi:hypothetical protein
MKAVTAHDVFQIARLTDVPVIFSCLVSLFAVYATPFFFLCFVVI